MNRPLFQGPVSSNAPSTNWMLNHVQHDEGIAMSETFLAGRVALVTGASRGIGAALAEALAGAGAHVVITARTAPDLEAVEERIHEAGGSATIAPLDLTESDS